MRLRKATQFESVIVVFVLSITGVRSAPQIELERWENETETSKEYVFQTLNHSNLRFEGNHQSPSSSDSLSTDLKTPTLSNRTNYYYKNQKESSAPKVFSDKTTDDIQFHENKPLSIRSPLDNPKPSTFFTQNQKHQLFHFPKDFTNPNNRLQVTDEELAAITNAPEVKLVPSNLKEFSEEKDDSIFSSSSHNKIDSNEYPQDEIPTMDLTLNIMKASNWGEDNIVFSPLSICNVLGLLMMGSQGKTFNEIAQVLNVKEAGQVSQVEISVRFHEAFHKLLSLLQAKSGKNVSLEIANEIFTDKHFNTTVSYISDAQKYYQTPVESFDFGSDGELFRDLVNDWVRRKTNGKIRTIIDEPPSPATTLAFINAVYFKGAWEVPFIERITRKKEFFVKPNETIEVKMMTNVLTIPFLEHDDYQLVGIPYKGNRTGFFVILPKSSKGIEGLKELERKLSAKDLLEQLTKMQLQKVALKIPKMKIATDGHMKEILSNMGIPTMFDSSQANFSKISTTDGLYVSAVHHRAMMEVNEKGTEAAAVTIGTGDRTIDELPIPFVANKPFIFFIYHVKAKCVLFWGRVTRPQSH